jgi:hypothetical protein
MELVFDYSWEEPNESDSWRLYTPVRQRNNTKPAEYWDGQVYKGLLHRLASDFLLLGFVLGFKVMLFISTQGLFISLHQFLGKTLSSLFSKSGVGLGSESNNPFPVIPNGFSAKCWQV